MTNHIPAMSVASRLSHPFRQSAAGLAVLSALAVLATPAQALQFGSEESGLTGSFDSTLSYGFIRRGASRDCTILGNDNGGCNRGTNNPLSSIYNLAAGTGYASADFNYTNFDDGDLNYNKGDIVSSVLKGTHELSLKGAGGWSALGRFTWFADSRIDKTARTPLDTEAKDYAVSGVDLLDLWVAKSFEVSDRQAKVKFGYQVMSWGEDIFILGGVNQINAVDLRKYHTPGTQLKEIFVPAPMLSFNTAVTNRMNLEGYYQFAWNPYRFDAVGTYFSNYDVVGKGNQPGYYPTSVVNDFLGAGTCAGFTPTGKCGDPATSGLDNATMIASGLAIPFAGDNKPKNNGQFGLATRFNAPEIDGEFAFYYQRYHDKLPFLGFTGTTPGTITSYSWNYAQDRNLFGASLNTKLGPVAVGAEVSLRPRDSVAVDPTVPFGSQGASGKFNSNSVYDVGFHPGYVDERKWQAQTNFFYAFSHNDPLGGMARLLGASDGFMLGEVAVTSYPNLDTSGVTPYSLPNYTLPTRTSWGYVLEAGLNYPNWLNTGLTFTPQIDWAHDVHGTSPNALPFVEGRKALTVSLLFNFRDQWKGTLQAVQFMGGGDNNLMRDRDFFSASVSYSF